MNLPGGCQFSNLLLYLAIVKDPLGQIKMTSALMQLALSLVHARTFWFNHSVVSKVELNT